VLLAVIAGSIAAVAGCGSGGGGSSSTSSTPSGGTLTVAADATYAPNEFIAPDGKTIEGMDADLANALGAQLKRPVKVVNATFDTIIPGLAAGKYDLGMSSFTDTKAREQTVNFVTYFSAGTSFYTKSAGGTKITGLSDLCGHKVAVEKGTTQATDAADQGKKCKSAGKGGVSVLVFPDQNGANLALSSGRADLVMADSPVAAYAVKQSAGKFALVGQMYGTAPYGIAVPKKSSALPQQILTALKTLMTNGTYTGILTKWGVQGGAISNPTINGATS
jgi:polar amino acid transport system substrate-binding protein